MKIKKAYVSNEVSEKELKYRNDFYKDVKDVLSTRLYCTCCLHDVKNETMCKNKVYIHPFLKVLICRECSKFYGDGIFSADEDGTERYCKWCGKGGFLYLCNDCPASFCKACVKRNISRKVRNAVEEDDWKCFLCNPEPLYDLRALAWALKEVIKSGKKKDKSKRDTAEPSGHEGVLKSTRLFLLDNIQIFRKSCRSLDSKLGVLTRKEQASVDELTELYSKVSELVTSSISTIETSLSEFKEKWITIHKKLEDSQVQKNNIVDSIESEGIADKDNFNKINGNSESIEEPKCLGNTSDESSEQLKLKDEIIKVENDRPKPLLKIRKVEEINEALLAEGSNKGNVSKSPDSVSMNLETDIISIELSDSEVSQNSSIKNESLINQEQIIELEKSSDEENNIEETNKPSERQEIRQLKDTIERSTRSKSLQINKSLPSDKNEKNKKRSESDELKKNKRDLNTVADIMESEKEETEYLENDAGEMLMEESTCSKSEENGLGITEDFVDGEKNKTPDSTVEEKDNVNLKDTENIKDKVVSYETGKDGSSESNESNSDVDDGNDLSSNDSDFEVKLKTKKGHTKSGSNKNNKDSKKHNLEKNKSKEEPGKNKPKENSNPLKRKRKKNISDETDSENSKVKSKKRQKKGTKKGFDSDESVNMDNLEAEIGDIVSSVPSYHSIDVARDLEMPLCLSDDDGTSEKEDEKGNKSIKSKKSTKNSVVSVSSDDDNDVKYETKKDNFSDSESDDIFKKKSVTKKNKNKKKLFSDSEEEFKDDEETAVHSDSNDEGSDIEKDSKDKRHKRIRKNSSDSSDEDKEKNDSPNKGFRKNIKKIIKKDDLKEETQTALKEEQERKKRIVERQKMYNEVMGKVASEGSNLVDKLVLDFDTETKEELLSVDKDLVGKLKPHQAEGVKFMWDSCFETLEKLKSRKGSGCILAHCMGLGKTLQVVTLVHTLLSCEATSVKTVLVLCPLSTVLNWANEFNKWLADVGSGEDVEVYHFSKVAVPYRATQLREWQRTGGVFILGYSLFRNLVNPTKKIKASYRTAFLETLTEPGPDLVICDEGHILKNEATALSKSVAKIKTLRRIVLTGTPLQNNLIEYHCMVQFVKPNLLGTKKEFTNRFVNPINNGQFVDSTSHDVKVMKRRAHVLHNMLDGIVQRKAYSVLVPFLPPKFEYVLSLSLSEIQCKLYRYYLDNFSRKTDTGQGASLFKDRNMLNLICSHPKLIKVQSNNEMMRKEMEETDEEGSLKDFIDDESSSSDSSSSSSSSSGSESNSGSSSSKRKKTRTTRSNNEDPFVSENPEEKQDEEEKKWWSNIITDEQMEEIKVSSKMTLFFTILAKCEEIGDKILLFSQSLLSLDLLEEFLEKVDNVSGSDELSLETGGFKGSWVKGLDYFRLDGKTSSENRTICCNKFNDEDNLRARLFLISTRAGGMGINLTGANRVIIFDASWNPSDDVQSIFRIYRFGQSKPCYIYRFLSKGTMEQKVYDRQVTKLSMACRVIDEQQIDRHFSYADLNELYSFSPNEEDNRTPVLPKDLLLAELLQEHRELILSYHTHDSLLENQLNEELNEEERKAAWADFENEKKGVVDSSGQYLEIFNKAYESLKRQNPLLSDEELRNSANVLIQKMKMAQMQQLQMMQYQNMMRQQQQIQQMQQQQMQQQQMQQQLFSMQGIPRPIMPGTRMQMVPKLQTVNRPPVSQNWRQPSSSHLLMNPFASSNQLPNQLPNPLFVNKQNVPKPKKPDSNTVVIDDN